MLRTLAALGALLSTAAPAPAVATPGVSQTEAERFGRS